MKLRAGLLSSTAVLLVLTGHAMAADLSAPVAPAPAVAKPASWDGGYIGMSIGRGWGTASDAYTGPISNTINASLSGWLIGGQVGYNFHLSDNVVGGVEGNLDWLNEAGAYGGGGVQTINYEGSLRGRLGIDVGSWLPYLEGGIAAANTTEPFGPSTATQIGWTAGAGVEVQVADHVSANFEYRYSDYGTATLSMRRTPSTFT